MFLRKTTIICQVYVTLFLVPFLDMLSSIPGVLSVYSSLVLNHIFAFLSILEGMLRKPWLRLLLAHFEKHENLNKNAFLVKLRYTKKNCVKLFKHTALFHPFLVFNLRTLLKLQTCIMFLIRPNINARVFLVFNSPHCPLICCLIGLLTTTAVQLDAAL